MPYLVLVPWVVVADHFRRVYEGVRENRCALRQATFVEGGAGGCDEDLQRRQSLLSVHYPPLVDEALSTDLLCDDRAEKVRSGIRSLGEDLASESRQVVPQRFPLALLRPNVVPLVAGNGVLLPWGESKADGRGLSVQHGASLSCVDPVRSAKVSGVSVDGAGGVHEVRRLLTSEPCQHFFVATRDQQPVRAVLDQAAFEADDSECPVPQGGKLLEVAVDREHADGVFV